MTESDLVVPAPAAFAALAIDEWRQFDSVDLRFHPRLTVLTGANATGKSTLLGILARHFNWSRGYSAAPVRVRGQGGEWVTVGKRRARRLMKDQAWAEVGAIEYGSGQRSPINVPIGQPSSQRVQYDVQIPQQEAVNGAFLSSHRTVPGNYAMVDTIPTLFGDAQQLFDQFTNEMRTRWSGGWSGKPTMRVLKEALIAAAVFGGHGSAHVEFNPEAAAIWEGFQEVLTRVMPKSLGYEGIRIRVPDVIIETRTGDFILDDASGGLTAIIEVSWQIFLRERTMPAFTVLMDEPENHLHPSLQRELLPSLLDAFPRVQFILATHSPFVVTATSDSAVFALDYNSEGRVFSRELDYANKAGNADETLRRVLGLDSTMPKWAEREFRRIVENYMVGGMTSERLVQLRAELVAQGLESEFPDAVISLADRSASDQEGPQS